MQLTARELPNEPAIYRSECKFAGLSLPACSRDIVENPGHFAAGEIGIDEQSGAFLNHLLVAVGLELVA